MSVYLFVGPYLEFLTPVDDAHECPKELWGSGGSSATAKSLRLHSFASFGLIKAFSTGFGGYGTAGLSPDGNTVYAGGQLFNAFDRATGERSLVYDCETLQGLGLWVSHDHKFIAAGSPKGSVYFRVGNVKPVATSPQPMPTAHPGRGAALGNHGEVVLLCSPSDPAFKKTPKK